MMAEGQYNNDDLLVRLRAVFGRVDQVRHHIDLALQQEDTHRRKGNIRFLIFVTFIECFVHSFIILPQVS